MHILELEVTTRCNLNCKHCYNRRFDPIDMPFDRMVEFFKFANENKVWTLIISGGEALLHPDFIKFNQFAKRNDRTFRLILQSNGTLMQGDVINMITNFDLVHLSFDLADDVRIGGKNNLQLAQKLKKRGIDSYLFATVHKRNYKYIDKMVKMANDKNIPIGFNLCIPTGNVDTKYLLTRNEFFNVEKKLFEMYKRKLILRYTSPLVSVFDDNKRSRFDKIKGGCTAGIAACVVAPDGDVYPCPFFRLSAGNIYKDSLVNIWNNSKLFNKLRSRRKLLEPCASCEFLQYCGGCRKRAYEATKNIYGCDPMCYRDLLK